MRGEELREMSSKRLQRYKSFKKEKKHKKLFTQKHYLPWSLRGEELILFQKLFAMVAER
jgi:hypothetical protein